jgi:hypothetical protein
MAAVFKNGLTNIYIQNFLEQSSKLFRGVFSANTIYPGLLSLNNFSIVCNLSRYAEPGTHFVCILAYPNYVIYIDSFGLECSSSDINEFLVQLNRPIYHSTTQVQAIVSNFCGFFCILQVLAREANINIEFSHVLEENDAICVNYIKSLIK